MKKLSKFMIMYCLVNGIVGSYIGENLECSDHIFSQLIIAMLILFFIISSIGILEEKCVEKEKRNYKKQLEEALIGFSLTMVTIGTSGITLYTAGFAHWFWIRLMVFLLLLVPPYAYFLKLQK